MAEDKDYGFYMKPLLPEGTTSMEVGAMGRDPMVSAEPWFGVDGGKLPYPVYMRVGRDQNGRLAVMGLHIDELESWRDYGPRPTGASITARSLRDVGTAVIDVQRAIAEHRLEDATMAALVGPLFERSAMPYAGVSMRPGRYGHPDAFYRDVAEAYVRIVARGEAKPFAVLEKELFRSESQTRRLVKRARELYPELFLKGGGS